VKRVGAGFLWWDHTPKGRLFVIQDDVTVPLVEKRSFSPEDFLVVIFERTRRKQHEKIGLHRDHGGFLSPDCGYIRNPGLCPRLWGVESPLLY
jgi:hypothetical protein